MAASIPAGDNERIAWARLFMHRIVENGARYDLSADEIAEAVRRCETLIYVIELKHAALLFKRICADYKRAMCGDHTKAFYATPKVPVFHAPPSAPAEFSEARIIPFLQKLAQRVKVHPNYAGGDRLQIKSKPAAKLNVADARPRFKTSALSNSVVRIDWRKYNFDGVEIQSRRGAETEFTALERDFRSPYIDTRLPLETGKAETREYRLIYLLNDKPVGVHSHVEVASTLP